MESIASKERKRDRIRKFLGRDTGKPDGQSASEDAIALRPKASLEDPHRLAAVDSAAVVSETPKVATDDLWAEAYERCKLRENDLVDRYEQHMKTFTSSAGTAADDRFSPGKIAGLIKAQRGDLDAQRLTLRLRERSTAIREQGEKIVKFVLWFNSTISSALASQPYASLAWSAVSIILPLLLNPSKQSQKMMDGLQTISDLMRRCQVREELFPRERKFPQGETIDAYTELRNASLELYSYIFEYEARSVCHLSHRSAHRALSGVFETNDWTGILEKIDNVDKTCASLLALFDKSKEHTLQERQAKELIHQTGMFEDFQRHLLETQQYNLEANLMSSLASDYESDKALIARRVDGTCEWFFRDQKFHRWRENESSSLFWISAGPGCGKSVLAKTLIDECRLSSASALHTTTCYFFFKEGEERRSKAANALGAILHQLFDQNPQLISNALPSSKSYGDNLSNTFSELWKVLMKTAEDENAGHVICVLDALDECEEKSRQMVIDKIIDYYRDRSQHTTSAVLKFLVTSRPYSRVRSAFEHLRGINEYVHLDGDKRSTDISNDINFVIDYKVPRMTQNFAIRDRERISSRLKEMKHSTYLWLYLTLDVIDREQGKYSKASKIETLLSYLPVDVSDAYERILFQSNHIESARILLQIIIAAGRPLTLAEANVALTMATHRKTPRSLDELDLWPEGRFKSTVQDMCGLFVSVHDGKLSLIHQTARQFLVQTVTEESNDVAAENKRWSRCFTIQCADEVLCSICVKYLTLDDFTKETASRKQGEYYAGASSGAPVFFRYAADQWTVHYKRSPQRKRRLLQDQAIALCKPDDSPGSHWLPPIDLYYQQDLCLREDSNSDWSPIGIASVAGLADVVQCLLAGATKVNDHGAGHCETATRAAILMNHTEVLRVLCPFNTSARYQLDPRSDLIALQAPCARLPLSTETILQSSAKTRISDDLFYAVFVYSSLETIRILLEHGADPNVQKENGETLLQSTISHPLDYVSYDIRMILRNESRKHVRSKKHTVAEQVRLLLEFGADPNMQSNDKTTPLQKALRNGYCPLVVSLLLQAGAKVNIASAAGGTPIFLAKRELRRVKESGRSDAVEQAAKKVQLLRDAGAKEDIEEASNEEDASRSRDVSAHDEVPNLEEVS